MSKLFNMIHEHHVQVGDKSGFNGLNYILKC